MAGAAHGIVVGIIVLLSFTTTYVYGITTSEGEKPEGREKNHGKKEETQSYTTEELQNVYVPKYLEAFKEFQELIPGEDTNDAMELVKLFIIQSWIHTLQPDLKVLRELLPLDEKATLEDAKQEVIKKIRNTDKITPAADAILLYFKFIDQDVKIFFTEHAYALKVHIESIVKRIESENDEQKRKELIQENNEKEEELRDVLFCLDFHKIARRMWLQSYVLDFVGETMDKKMVITSTNGRGKNIFYVPPLKAGNFWALVDETEIERDNAENLLS